MVPEYRNGPIHTITLPDSSKIHAHVLLVEEDHALPGRLSYFQGLIEVPAGKSPNALG